MIYVSFVSKNTKYEEVIKKYLIPSLIKWNLPYDIEYIENKGSWRNNVLYKSYFIKKMLLKHKQSIISLDADAEIIKYPYLFEKLNDYDIGAHLLDWNSWYGHTNGRKELLGGTLYFNYNPSVLKLIELWIKITKSTGNLPQRILENIVKDAKYLKLFKLPVEYCYINTLPNGKAPLIKTNPVIVHYQASRTLRNNIK